MIREAGKKGADWILHIDADEVFAAHASEKIRKLAEF